MKMLDITNIILKINRLFEEEYFKDYEKKYNVIPDEYEKQEFVIDSFTHGGCAIYGEFLYDIFKDYGATLVSSNDHILVKIDNFFYDVTGLNLNPEYDGYIPFNIENDKEKEQYEYYKDAVCGLYSNTRKEKYNKIKEVLNNIRDQIKEEVVKTNKEKVLKKD